jgi:Zn-finger nucleic acid-binding protein
MKCPVCKEVSLKSIYLESSLPAFTCESCRGHWVTSYDYWVWLERHPSFPLQKSIIEMEGHLEKISETEKDRVEKEKIEEVVVGDRPEAKLCPECQHIMLRYRIGHGLSYSLDQCGNCNSLWFDKNKWQGLRQRNLHHLLHLIASAPWQMQLRRDETRDILDAIYAERFRTDYEKIKQIKEWLDQHPEKEWILDYFNNTDPYSIRD